MIFGRLRSVTMLTSGATPPISNQIGSLCDYPAAATLIEVALFEYAPRLDASPHWLMLSFVQHMQFAGMPMLDASAAAPQLNFGTGSGSAFECQYAREIIDDRVLSVCHLIERHAGAEKNRGPRARSSDRSHLLMSRTSGLFVFVCSYKRFGVRVG